VSRVALMTALIACLPVSALGSGRRVGTRATQVFVYKQRLMPNTQYRIETRNLSLPSDTVLHVQTSSGAHLAGNDDCAGAGSTRSCVTIGTANAVRDVTIVVRASSEQTGGHGTLRVGASCPLGGICTPSLKDVAMPWFGGVTVPLGETVPARGKVLTVRERDAGVLRGAADTVVLVRKSVTQAVAFDDESGLRASPEYPRGMAKATLASDCPTCVVTVGTVAGSPEGTTTLLWDTDAGSRDCDGDGWGDSLEALHGANPCVLDTDQDGLPDGEEIEGATVGGDSLQLAFWGARPNHKDFFLEADWEPDANGGNSLQQTVASAQMVAGIFADDPGNRAGNPDGVGGIAVHIDNGRPNGGTVFGNWGGASRLPPKTTQPPYAYCEGLTATRTRHFRHARTHGGNSQASGTPASCLQANFGDGYNTAHEIGHLLGLAHGGSRAAFNANGKPNYPSIMAYGGPARFSAGTSVALNPTRLDENFGLGTTDAAILDRIAGYPFYFRVDRSTGAIDWNRDGLFESAARGAPNYIATSAEWLQPHVTYFGHDSSAAFLARAGTDTYLFDVGATDGVLRYRKTASVLDCDQGNIDSRCPNDLGAGISVPGAAPMGQGAAIGFDDPVAGASTLMVVYRDAVGRLVYQRGFIGAGISWTSPTAVDLTGTLPLLTVSDEPTLVDNGGFPMLHVPMGGGRIAGLSYDPWAQRWWGPGTAKAADGSDLLVVPGTGIGTVSAFEAGGTRQVYGAFLQADTTLSKNVLRFAKRDPSTGRWQIFGASAWVKPELAQGTPRLGYVPFNRNDPTVGRFWMMFRDPVSNNHRTLFSYGNDSTAGAGFRALKFDWNQAFNFWGYTENAYSLLSDGEGLRATLIQWKDDRDASGNVIRRHRNLWFIPFADGVFDAEFRDTDDFQHMGRILSCSLARTACVL
jgi:hypothetical protein